uniref:MGF factor n=1 Tax=Malurus cyaneus samueli TaxID=2593467 RepID=A0A8C5TSI3_9PASS
AVPAGGLALLLGVLLWAPWRTLHGAPLAELSGDQDFQLFLQRNLEFTRKILGDVAALQRETCFSQIRAGLHAYHGSLATIQNLLPGHAGLVETLQLDMANLSSNIQQQMEDLGLATVTYPSENQNPLPTFSSHFHHQVGGFFILANFQRFLETAYRALRHLANL